MEILLYLTSALTEVLTPRKNSPREAKPNRAENFFRDGAKFGEIASRAISRLMPVKRG